MLLLLCFPLECDSVWGWVSVFVWCLHIRVLEFMSEYTFELLCIPIYVCYGSLCVFIKVCMCVHTHTHTHTQIHTHRRALGSPNMLNGPLRLLHVGLGVDREEGGQREAAGFCKNIKSQIK